MIDFDLTRLGCENELGRSVDLAYGASWCVHGGFLWYLCVPGIGGSMY
jgi:hypothetical protein